MWSVMVVAAKESEFPADFVDVTHYGVVTRGAAVSMARGCYTSRQHRQGRCVALSANHNAAGLFSRGHHAVSVLPTILSLPFLESIGIMDWPTVKPVKGNKKRLNKKTHRDASGRTGSRELAKRMG
ncbi:hypothetical protein E2C01_006350 [Portunus trituberculatus]|uniref:Uncharacterized protein n=1 Tax=Portunus trituberculatus TaxID=210409 RepID=A0A5B7CW51_PORTR|nr:hypothetical protein [Portunus trituberculatus]